MTSWLLIQKFNVRASTMMLGFIVVMLIVYKSDFLYNFFSSFLPLWRVYSNMSALALTAVLFAVIFLVHSVIRKNLQIQYSIELAISLLLFFLMPQF